VADRPPPVLPKAGALHLALRRIGDAILPARLLITIRAIRARQHKHRLAAEWGLTTLSRRLGRRFNMTVQSGPFKGLLLPPATLHEHLGPTLLGLAERELQDTWLSLTKADAPSVVNIGSCVGYYAVGLARRFGCPAVAFDPDPWARRATRATARLNGVSITTHAQCSREWLEAMTPGPLVVMDCEGYETVLLRAPIPRSLVRSVMVIEVHEDLQPGSEQRLIDALMPTHDVERIASNAALPDAPVDISFLDTHGQEMARMEIREPQSWLVCRPNPNRS
jgi:hypothetical protein